MKIKLDTTFFNENSPSVMEDRKEDSFLTVFPNKRVIYFLSGLVVIFLYLYYFVEGALCIPWKHTSQNPQGKSM